MNQLVGIKLVHINDFKLICFEIRSDEERFFKPGSEPLIEPLSIADLSGPFFMGLVGLGLSVLAFVKNNPTKNRRGKALTELKRARIHRSSLKPLEIPKQAWA